MKKLFLTTIVAFATLFASAQFMVVTSMELPTDSSELGLGSFTDNMGVGYQINDKLTVGAVKSGETYELFGRYYMQGIYATVQMPMEEASENMSVGLGYSFNLWKGLYVEPNYMMDMKEDENGEREGELKIGVAYKF